MILSSLLMIYARWKFINFDTKTGDRIILRENKIDLLGEH